MKYSMQLSDAIHILVYIQLFEGSDWLSSEKIASSVETNPANVRRIMSNLKRAHLILTQTGKAAPTLARAPEQISLLDVYRSIEGNTNLIQVDPKTNPDCIVGANIQTVLGDCYASLQETVEAEMATITLDTLLRAVATEEIQKRPENAPLLKAYL